MCCCLLSVISGSSSITAVGDILRSASYCQQKERCIHRLSGECCEGKNWNTVIFFFCMSACLKIKVWTQIHFSLSFVTGKQEENFKKKHRYTTTIVESQWLTSRIFFPIQKKTDITILKQSMVVEDGVSDILSRTRETVYLDYLQSTTNFLNS